VIDINLTGTYLGIRATRVLDPQSRGGAIVNISSGAGMSGAFGLGAYVASKWSVRGLTNRGAGAGAATHIRRQLHHPGATRTTMAAQPDVEAVMAASVRALRFPRIAEPEELRGWCCSSRPTRPLLDRSEFIADGVHCSARSGATNKEQDEGQEHTANNPND